tara:strand:+ start:10943 stop:12121 length:1179 start_codon:yes stop_codon:yes gene_type:complete
VNSPLKKIIQYTVNKIYLDNNSTTQVDPNVLKHMIPYFNEKYGNPSSQSHAFGWEANAAVEIAREQVAQIINAKNEEIVFTSGATESNNLAIYGLYEGLFSKTLEMITTEIEHKAVLDVCKKISKKGHKIHYLKPTKDGIINLEEFKKTINKNVKIVSIMHANNEIGTIQPIKEIGKLCRNKNIFFHVDAAQSLGKINIDVKDMNIDLLSISSHKIYGPKGIGALFINSSNKKINIEPIIVGGSQEKNFRSGTLPTPMIVGFGMACKIAKENFKSDQRRIRDLSNKLIQKITHKFPKTIINGSRSQRIPGNVNLTFPFLNGMSIINSLPEIAVSSGSACSSSKPNSSHVLKSIGLDKNYINSTIRIGIGKFNSDKHIEIAINALTKAIERKI